MENTCPNKTLCGSCKWSDIAYEQQLQQKKIDINEALKQEKLSLKCNIILPSPAIDHYRNRMDFVIDYQGKVGLREKGKWWRVIDNHPCFISDQKIEEHFYQVRKWSKECNLSYFDRKAHTGFLRYAVIRATKKEESMIIIVTSKPANKTEKRNALEKLQQLAKHAKPTTLIWSINSTISDVSFGDELNTISGNGYIEETIHDCSYCITPNAFFQTNSHGAELLLQVVREYAGLIDTESTILKEKTILDLYCGSGFFSIALAKNVKKVIGVEIVPEAIQDAKKNAEINNIKNAQYIAANVDDFAWADTNPDIIIVDPTRAGLVKKVRENILKANPEKIIYVSCNYKNFAKEARSLMTNYNVKKMCAIDMFPHTPHVELVTLLERK